MKGGSAIYCPSCQHRQVVGQPGEKLHFPMQVTCGKCGAVLAVEKSESGGVHVTAGPAAAAP